MKHTLKALFVMAAAALLILAACDKTINESSAEPDSPTETNSIPPEDTDKTEETTEDGNGTDNGKNTGDDKLGDREENNYTAEKQDQEDSSDRTVDSSDEDALSKGAQGKREAYLQKLNEMEEADRNLKSGSTISELEVQEAERYKKWDEALNEIYAVLQEQLPAEEMNQLREDQREWIQHRDNAAKESSLKYEGGSYESLEYVATQATLTRERCYTLVASYMK